MIHVHSFGQRSVVLPSPQGEEDDVIPAYTPYLGMKLGKVRLVSYENREAKSCSQNFPDGPAKKMDIFSHHGPVAGGDSQALMDAFNLEEWKKVPGLYGAGEGSRSG